MLARGVLPRSWTLVVLALFALSPRMIYYSSEVKQYGFDLLASTGILLLAFGIRSRTK